MLSNFHQKRTGWFKFPLYQVPYHLDKSPPMLDHALKSTLGFSLFCLYVLPFEAHNKLLSIRSPRARPRSLPEFRGVPAAPTTPSRAAWGEFKLPRGSGCTPAWTKTKSILQISPTEVLPSHPFLFKWLNSPCLMLPHFSFPLLAKFP